MTHLCDTLEAIPPVFTGILQLNASLAKLYGGKYTLWMGCVKSLNSERSDTTKVIFHAKKVLYRQNK